MKVSLNWLMEYVDFKISPSDLADRLTMVGFEVEAIENLGEKYAKLVVGAVTEVVKHPNADRLSVCSVDVGHDLLQIVCGAPNVAVGQKIAVGLVGAVVPHDQHDPHGKSFTLSHVKVRGIDSFGMICSAHELDLGADKDGILVLDGRAKPGTPLARYLGREDTVFEVGITPNRPDAMSHIGIAREVAAILGTKIKLPVGKVVEARIPSRGTLVVRIEDAENCPRYTARVVRNVRVGPSPRWLQDRLSAVGIRPVNNVVDVSNYVLMEIGHPLHTFDYNKLGGQRIVVRLAAEGESLITLDHKLRALRSDTLLICDRDKPIAIAGVMGGENSEITTSTTSVVIESAFFKPQSVRRTSKAFGLNTDASQRFERGADPGVTLWAVDRAASLLQAISGGDVLKGVIDVCPKKIRTSRVSLRTEKVNEILGTNLGAKAILTHLAKINIRRVPTARRKIRSEISFAIPTNRPDIKEEIDLVEEVARLSGYDNIDTRAKSVIQFPVHAPEKEFTDDLREWLIGTGYTEIVVNSMQEKSLARLASDNIVEIANPISIDMAAMRTSLIPSALGIVRHNIFHGIKDLRFFEIGRVYRHESSAGLQSSPKGYLEEERLLLALTGMADPICWDRKPRAIDIFDVKGELQTLFNKISLDKIKFIPYSTTDALTESGLRVEINGRQLGTVGSIRKELLEMFGLEQDVYVSEISLLGVESGGSHIRTIQQLPKYPTVMRDLAFIVDASLPGEVIESAIRESGQPLLMQVTLFDIYVGDQAGPGKKSCAFALQFFSAEHTLTQDEVERIMRKIIGDISSTFNAALRR